uniref:Putative venom gland protein n=1 Tax=Superstitionia donensis TaxID=311983 RepID=A0A1V1WBK8_9SCOR
MMFLLAFVLMTSLNVLVYSQDRCTLPPESGLCLAYFEKYYYDSNFRTCKMFVYGGCDGNDNRFDTEDACLAACAGSK